MRGIRGSDRGISGSLFGLASFFPMIIRNELQKDNDRILARVQFAIDGILG